MRLILGRPISEGIAQAGFVGVISAFLHVAMYRPRQSPLFRMHRVRSSMLNHDMYSPQELLTYV